MSLKRAYKPVKRAAAAFLVMVMALSALVAGGFKITDAQAATGLADRTNLVSPAYRSDLTTNDVTITFGNQTGATAKVYSQKQPVDLSVASSGTKALVADVTMSAGLGSFLFPASQYPNGPIAIRIDVYDANSRFIDTAYFQFYNKVGVVWKTGLENAPENPVTERMAVTFADDFSVMPNLSNQGMGMGSTPDNTAIGSRSQHSYATRKCDSTGGDAGGMFGWGYFADYVPGSRFNPFEIVDGEYMNLKTTYYPTDGEVPWKGTYWDQKVGTGYLSSMGMDGSGFHTTGGHNQYFECRMFTGPNPGLWPAFWLLTSNGAQYSDGTLAPEFGGASDEIDINESYLGSPDGYQTTGHQWNYTTGKGGGAWNTIDASPWSNINIAMGFHTFACLITEDKTYYYCDNIEVFSHDTLEVSWELGNYFIINGGVSDHFGIPQNGDDSFGPNSRPLGFTRYGNECYTYVDWVRVYEDVDDTARFEAVKTKVTAISGDYVPVNIKRNAAAQELGGDYIINFPTAGWQVWNGTAFVSVSGTQATLSFAAGSAVDQLIFVAPNTSIPEGSLISVLPSIGGVPLPPAVVFGLIVEGDRGTQVGINSRTYPFRNTSGGTSGSWSGYDPNTNDNVYFNFISGGWWNEGWSWMHDRSANNGRMTFTFTGNAFELYTINFDYGWKFTIDVDGHNSQVVDTYAPSEGTDLAYSWSDPTGTDARHVVTIVTVANAPDNDHHIRMDNFVYWYHENPNIPKYTLEDTYFEASNDPLAAIRPGSVIDIRVNRNVATASTYGSYNVTLPQGYELVSAASLVNRPQDIISVRIPSDPSWLGKFDTISITGINGQAFAKPMNVTVKSPDPQGEPPITGDNVITVNKTTYPYVNVMDGSGAGAWYNGWNGSAFDKSTQDFDYFTFNGGWWCDGWGWMYTNATDGQYVDFTFAGDAVALYVEYHNEGCAYEIFLDGVSKGTFNSKGNSPDLRVFSASGLSVAEHTLRVMSRGSGYMKINGYDYNYIASAETSKRVQIDASTYPGNGPWSGGQPGKYFTNLDGGWWCDSWGWMYVHANSNSSIDFNFTGTEVWAYGRTYDGAGRAEFYIDGVLAGTFDTSIAAANMVEYFHADGLMPAAHVLTVKTLNEGRPGDFILSGFAYMSTPNSQAVRYTLDKYAVNSLAGADFDLTVRPSAAADTYGGTYDVILPEGWTVNNPEVLPFAPGDGNKTISIHIPDSEYSSQKVVLVQPVIGTYRSPALSVNVRLGKPTPPDIVSLLSPDYRADISGTTALQVAAPGGYTMAKAMFTHAPDAAHPNEHGYTYVIGPVSLDANGRGIISVNADIMPSGPVMIKVEAYKPDGKTMCDGYFQFYNQGGEAWNAGMNGYDAGITGKYDPGIALPAKINEIQAELGKEPMKAVFADDFKYSGASDITNSISRNGLNKTYAAHYPNGLDDRGYFAGPEVGTQYGQIYNPYRAKDNQYLQMITQRYDTTLSETALSWAPYANYYRYTSGCLSSVNEEGHSPKKLADYPDWDGWTNGYTEQYLEARIFFGPNPGEWPAFWTLSNMSYREPDGSWREGGKSGWRGTDELDICEGWMPSKAYSVNTHQWSYSTGRGGNIGTFNAMDLIGNSAPDADPYVGDFQMGFHTYGCYITEEYTYYFFDGELIGSEPTLDLSWRDGNRFLINSGVAQDKEQSLPEGYGFTRYGDQSHMYVDWVRVWETPVAAEAPVFDLDYDYIELQTVVPGQNLTIGVKRVNDAAKALSGTYDLNLPAGWTVVSGANFSASASKKVVDTIVVSVPPSYVLYAADVKITPTVGGQAVHKELVMHTRNSDNAFSVNIYPVYNKNGGWDAHVDLVNASAYEITGGSVSVKSADSPFEFDDVFAAVPAHGSRTVTVPNIPININNLQNFTFEIVRNDGYERVIDRPMSGLTATHTGGINISAPFNAGDWAGAMNLFLGGESVYNKTWGGEDDLSVNQYVKYDAANLYIAAIVKDDIGWFGEGDFGGLWSYDSIQLSFDSLRAGGFAPEAEHIRLTGGINAQGRGGLGLETFLYNGYNANSIATNFYRDEASKTTVYMMAIPWGAILPAGVNPTADKTDIGFTLLINDNDGLGGRGWIRYMNGIATGKNPAQFGDLILTDDSSVVVNRTVTGIAVANSKTVYGEDEEFDFTALNVRRNYSDGSYDTLIYASGGYTLAGTGFVKGQVGEQTLIVTDGTYSSAPFTVTVVAGNAVYATALVVASYPDKLTGYAPYEPLDTAGLALKVLYSDGSEQAVTSGYTVDFDSSTGGVKLVTITYQGLTTTFNAVVDGSLSPYADPVRIWVDENASTLVYRLGEPLSLVVRAEYEGGGVGTLPPARYTVAGYDADTPGSQLLTITYTDKIDPNASVDPVTVTVTVVGETGIAWVSGPTKAKYHVGEALNLAGLVVNLEYSDPSLNRPITVTANMLSGFDSDTAGNKTVTVTYNGYTASFTVTVYAVTGIRVVPPSKLSYYVGDTLNQAGMQVYAVYAGYDEVRLTSGYTVSPTALSAAGDIAVTVEYLTFSGSFTVSVETHPTVTGISVTTLPVRRNYYVGETFSPAGMIVSATYDKNPIGSSTNVVAITASEYEVSCAPLSGTGTYTVTVIYNADTSMTDSFTVEAEAAPVVTGIQVTPPSKTRYYLGDALDTAGMTVYEVYDKPLTYGGTVYTKAVSLSLVTISPDTFNAAGDPVTVTVSYGGFNADFNVTVFDREQLYVNFDWTINGVQGGGFVPDTDGLRASTAYPYNTNFLRIWEDDYSDPYSAGGYGRAVDYDGAPVYEIFKNNHGGNWLMFYFTDEVKTRGWYDPEGMWLTFTVKYFDAGPNPDASNSAGTGSVELNYKAVGGWDWLWVDSFSRRDNSLSVTNSEEWKTRTVTAWVLPGSFDMGSDFALSFGGPVTIGLSYLTVSPSTEEEIASTKIATGIEIQRDRTKTVYFVGDEFVPGSVETGVGDMEVWLTYSDGTHDVLMNNKWGWQTQYSATGFDSSAAGVCTVTVKLNNSSFTDTIDMTIKRVYTKLKVWYDESGEHNEGLYTTNWPGSFQMSHLGTENGYTGLKASGEWKVTDKADIYSNDLIEHARITIEFYDSGILSTDTDTYIRCSVPGNTLYGDSFGRVADIGPGIRRLVYDNRSIYLNGNVYDWDGLHQSSDFIFYTRGRTILIKSVTIEWGRIPAITDFAVTNAPDKSMYYFHELPSGLDMTGFRGTASYSDGSAEAVNYGDIDFISYSSGNNNFTNSDYIKVISCVPDPSNAIVYIVTVEYGGLRATFTVDARADKRALDELIAEVDDLFLDPTAFNSYTKDSVAKLKEALDAAKAVSDNDYSTQAAVDAAYEALRTALDNVMASQAEFVCSVKSMLAKVGKLQQIPYTWDGEVALVFSTSNAAVCNVTQDGVLVPMKVGIAVITITLPNRSTYTFAVSVSV